MSTDVKTPEPSSQQHPPRIGLSNLIALLMLLVGVANHFLRLVSPWVPSHLKTRVDFSVSIGCIVLAALACRDWFLLKAINRKLRDLNPWLVIVVLVLSAFILQSVIILRQKPAPVSLKYEPIAVIFDSARGQIFNSWNAPFSPHSRYIKAIGTSQDINNWYITDHGSQASFSYSTYPRIRPSDDASSGGYMTFYSTPCDRRIYRKVTFLCKASEACPRADVALRLAVDDPNQKTERVAFEFPSLRTKGTIDNISHPFEIYFAEFNRVPTLEPLPPLPKGVDENTLNKIVFCITPEIAKHCPKNTIIISDVRFVR